MSKTRVVSKIVLPILLLTLLMGAGSVLAQTGNPDDGEGGQGRPMGQSAAGSEEEVVVQESTESAGDSPADGEGRPQTDFPTFDSEEVERLADPDAPQAQFFKRIAGSNFQPRQSTVVYSYSGGGCMQRDANTGDSWFTVDLQLPDGAEIDFLRVYFYDNNGTYNVNSELWAFDGAGGTTLIAEADSTGTPGYSSAGSGFFSHIVDNTNQSLVVVASIQGGVGSTLQLCGIRLRYQYNLSTNFLPTLMHHTNP